MKGLFEILTEKKWMVSPDFVHGLRKSLEQDLNTHAAFSKPEKTCGYVSEKLADGSLYYPEEYQISEDGSRVKGNWALSYAAEDSGQDFPFVSVLTVDGPITRNGGGCSYGSIDHRDMMMRAADHPLCRGHVFVINTPGGSAWAKNDYQQAIEYARSKGQPVLAFIDGFCASAGMYLASLCDERYYMHPKNEIGCIGVMAAFYTVADGSKNKFTDETYHELYDPESFDKNKAFRDIANDGKDEELIAELAELGVEFRADIKKACPNATDEHLHGKVFNAEDVKGILVDGQSTFFEVVKRAFALNKKTAEPNNTANTTAKQTNTNTNINMENYPLINAACGLNAGEIAVKEDGAFMNAELLDTLEAHLSASEQKVADAEQKATEAEKSLAELQSKVNDLTAQLDAANSAKNVAENALNEANEAHSKELETLRNEHSEAIAKKDEEIAALATDKSKVDEDLKGAKEAIAAAEQQIADKDAQIAELTSAPGEEVDAGAAPANNGDGAQVPTLRSFDPSKYKTNAERKAAFERFKRGEE